jgi:hypothetical protein
MPSTQLIVIKKEVSCFIYFDLANGHNTPALLAAARFMSEQDRKIQAPFTFKIPFN